MKKMILLVLLFALQAVATVSDGESIRQYFTCNGSTTTFRFTQPVNSADDILVYNHIIATGDEGNPLTEDTDYTIAATSSSYLNGGVVTISPALESTSRVVIVRNIKKSQETSPGAMSAAAAVLALDKLTRVVQDLEDRKDRSWHLQESDSTSFNMEIPGLEERAESYPYFGDDGALTYVVGVTPDDTPVSSFMATVLDDSDAATARNTLGGAESFDVDKYASFSAAIADIGATVAQLHIQTAQAVSTNETVPATLSLVFTNGGSLAIDSGKTVTINGPFDAGMFQVFSGAGTVVFGDGRLIQAKWFGVTGDGSTDDTATFQKALDAANDAPGSTVFFPNGKYRANLTIYADTILEGESERHTWIIPVADAPAITFDASQIHNDYIQLRNFRIDGADLQGSTSAQHGIFIQLPLVGEQDGTPLIGTEIIIIENIRIGNLSGRGIHMRAQNWTALSLRRFIQAVQVKNVFIHETTLAAIYIQGFVLESSFNNVIISSCGTSTSASPNDSPIVIKAEPAAAAPATISDFLIPSRIRFESLVVNDNAKTAATHTNFQVYVDGGRQIVFDTFDSESASTFFYGTTQLVGTNTIFDVTFKHGSIQSNTTPLVKAFHLVDMQLLYVNDVHAFSETTATHGVYIDTASYSDVKRIRIENSRFTVTTQLRDVRVEAIGGGGALTVYQPGEYTFEGIGGAASTLQTLIIAGGKFAYTGGERITFRNIRDNLIYWKATDLDSNSDVILQGPFFQQGPTEFITLEYNPFDSKWYEVDRSKATGTFKGIYDFDIDGGAIGFFNLAFIPDNATVTRFWYEVVTAFTSDGSATVQVGVGGDDETGIVNLTDFDNAVYSEGYHDGIPDGAATNFTTKSTDERQVRMRVITADLTAGLVYFYGEWVSSE